MRKELQWSLLGVVERCKEGGGSVEDNSSFTHSAAYNLRELHMTAVEIQR